MASSWTKFTSRCKSRFSALGRSCYLRRLHWREKYRQTRQELLELRGALAEREASCRQLERQNQQLQQQNQQLQQQVVECQRRRAESPACSLPLGEPPPGQPYGANLMALAVNLGRELGLRRSSRAMKIFLPG